MSVISNSQPTFDFNIPVLIIGGGACGMSAALSAKEKGADVIILERDKVASGSSALSTCLIPAAGTILQKESGVLDSPEIFANDIIRKARGKNDRDMAYWIAESSGPTVDWLKDAVNVPLNLVTGFYYPGHSKFRMHGSPNRTGTELMFSFNEAIKKNSIDLITSALVNNIYTDENKKILGVSIVRPDGKIESIGCRVLILACNGYGGDPEMVKKYVPEMSDAIYFGHSGNKGDAVKWGIELEAAIADMGGYQGHGAVTHPHGTLLFWGLLTEGGIQVNSLGKRFSNEIRGYSEQAVDVISQSGNIAWEIWTKDGHDLGLEFQDYRNGIEMEAIKKVNSIEEISSIASLPKENLVETFNEIKSCNEKKEKDKFGRPWEKTKILNGPYYFAKVTGALFHTQGGLVVNKSAQVLSNKGIPMPNLFAGGGAARGLSGPSRWGYLSGNGLLTATVLGRIAGQEACKLI